MPSRLKTTLARMDRTPVRESRLASARKAGAHPSAEDAYWTLARKVDRDLEELDARADRILAACR
jgi:hypothetical protein